MLRSLLALFLIATIPAMATAQATPTPQPTQTPTPQPTPQPAPTPHPSSPQRAITDWPNPHFHYGRHITIVTLAAPTVRQSCRLRKLTADTVICLAPFYQAQTVFQRTDILALIEPPSLDSLYGGLEAGAAAPAAVLFFLFLPYGWVLDLALIGAAIFFICSRFVHHDPSDHLHDILLYQRPNSTLTVPLH
jgi:hypothetical protein